MMAESECIDSVKYVTYNYSVKRPELFICMLHFLDSSIRSDSIRSDLPLKSVSQEWEIGSDRFDLRSKSDRTDLDRCTRKSNRTGIGSGSDRDRRIWLESVATLYGGKRQRR